MGFPNPFDKWEAEDEKGMFLGMILGMIIDTAVIAWIFWRPL